jgi:hypothetical protein
MNAGFHRQSFSKKFIRHFSVPEGVAGNPFFIASACLYHAIAKNIFKREPCIMKNSHSRGSAASPKAGNQPFPDYTGGAVCVYVNQVNNVPILWRFSVCATPSYCNIKAD